jgi:hypothetical protein
MPRTPLGARPVLQMNEGEAHVYIYDGGHLSLAFDPFRIQLYFILL